jgi:hypothetical protein
MLDCLICIFYNICQCFITIMRDIGEHVVRNGYRGQMQGARKTWTCARYSSDVRGHTCVVVNKWICFGAPACKVQSLYDLHLSLFTSTYTNNPIYICKSRPLAVVNYSVYSCYTPVWGARKGCRDRNLAEEMLMCATIHTWKKARSRT